MSTSYKIALGIAAVLALLLVVYVATQGNDESPTDDTPDLADRTAPQPRPTLRSDTDRTPQTRTPGTSRTPGTTPDSDTTRPGTDTDIDADTGSDDQTPAQVTIGQPRTTRDGSTGANDDLMARIRAGTGRTSPTTDTTTAAETPADDAPGPAADTTGANTATDDTPADDTATTTRSTWTTRSTNGTNGTNGSTTSDDDNDQTKSSSTTRRDSTTTQTTTNTDTPRTYTVEAGDNMFRISEKVFGSDRYWQAIAQANPTIDPTRLRIGQQLRLPARDDVVEEEIDDIDAPANTVVHTVGAGENLSRIAQQYYNDPTQWNLIYNANRDRIGSNPDRLQAGMKLQIPPAPPR